jgi:hypothetical protein
LKGVIRTSESNPIIVVDSPLNKITFLLEEKIPLELESEVKKKTG